MTEHEQGSAGWRAERIGKATASRMGDVMAKGRDGKPSRTRAAYLAELVIERLNGAPFVGYRSGYMDQGTEREPEARARYEFERGVTVETCGFIPHPTIAMSGASPDGLVGADGLVEFKCPAPHTHLDTLRGGAIDRGYVYQMQWEMAATGRRWCDFVSFSPDFPIHLQIKIVRVARDDGLIAEMTGAVRAFLADVDAAVAELSTVKEAA